jgi:biotin operon repressor
MDRNAATPEFFKPGADQHRLNILHQLQQDPMMSQHRIGRAIRLSDGAVNKYMREFRDWGWVQTRGRTNKSLQYYLTEEGRDALRRLEAQRAQVIVGVSEQLVGTIGSHIAELHERGTAAVWLVGATTGSMLAHAAICRSAVELLGVLETDTDRLASTVIPTEFVRAPRDAFTPHRPGSGIVAVEAPKDLVREVRPLAESAGLPMLEW